MVSTLVCIKRRLTVQHQNGFRQKRDVIRSPSFIYLRFPSHWMLSIVSLWSVCFGFSVFACVKSVCGVFYWGCICNPSPIIGEYPYIYLFAHPCFQRNLDHYPLSYVNQGDVDIYAGYLGHPCGYCAGIPNCLVTLCPKPHTLGYPPCPPVIEHRYTNGLGSFLSLRLWALFLVFGDSLPSLGVYFGCL
jgi:hypothetical protein